MRINRQEQEIRGAQHIEIVPPPNLIQFPLSPNQLEAIIGLPKSSFLRWEREGQISPVEQTLKGNLFEREISETNFTELLVYMKGLTRREVRRARPAVEVPKHPWLQTFDPTKPCTLVTPTGYVLRFAGKDQK